MEELAKAAQINLTFSSERSHHVGFAGFQAYG